MRRDGDAPRLRGAAECLALAESVLGALGAGEGEVTVTDGDSSLTRFARNQVHQNVAETGLAVRLRLQHAGREGVATIRGEASAELPRRLVRAAERARDIAPAREDLAPLPRPDGTALGPAAAAGATARSTPEERATSVGTVIAAAAARGLEAFGALSATTTRTAVVSTAGMRRDARTTMASLISVVRGSDGAGYAARHAVDIGDVDAAALAAEVVETAARNQGAEPLAPGAYEVVLSPYAVADLVGFLGYMGLGALAVQEQRSFVRLGEQLMSEAVSIVDDPTDPTAGAMPFDGEGVASRRVGLVEQGICRGVVYDTPTALRDGVASTGHSLPQPNTEGPMPRHLAMEAGDASVDELVRAIRRGVYVTRLWYVRVVHELRTVITGMTREGTFLIENGRLARPIRDLRFTQGIVDALSDVRGVGRERRLAADDGGAVALVPALHLGHFAFTS